MIYSHPSVVFNHQCLDVVAFVMFFAHNLIIFGAKACIFSQCYNHDSIVSQLTIVLSIVYGICPSQAEFDQVTYLYCMELGGGEGRQWCYLKRFICLDILTLLKFWSALSSPILNIKYIIFWFPQGKYICFSVLISEYSPYFVVS